MKLRVFIASALMVLSSLAPALANAPALAKHHAAAGRTMQHELAAHPDSYDAAIAKQAKIHGVPESLIHRVVMRESRYRPDAMHKCYFGLMQITYATARSMGYQGDPKGLLDAKTNLTYGVPYLANAFMVADSDPDRAVALYAHGYYYEAKRLHKLRLLRTAASDPVVKETVVTEAAPEPPANPVAQLFHAIASNSASNPAPEPAPQQTADAASAEMVPVEADVPLPPRRPNL